ncbi:uncharacterized protein TNCV_3238231 [Trichonephila clavipes]|nr:uncharacterized protein TNCV_3238231 [Trichonephila clavipes]
MEFNNQISVLTPNNWNTWKHDMQVLLMHYGCWQFIIQTKPEQPDEEATYKEKLDLQLRIQSTVQQIYRWKEEDFRVVKIEAELILEANRLQLMKQDLEKAENAYLSSFHFEEVEDVTWCYGCSSWRSNGKNDYQRKAVTYLTVKLLKVAKQSLTKTIGFESVPKDPAINEAAMHVKSVELKRPPRLRCGVVVRRRIASSNLSSTSLDHGSKLHVWSVAKSPRV